MDEVRRDIAARALSALIAKCSNPWLDKKRTVDNAIAYADMLIRRLGEIPVDAQIRSEEGQKKQ